MRQLGSALGLMLYEVTKEEYLSLREEHKLDIKKGYAVDNYILCQDKVVARREGNKVRTINKDIDVNEILGMTVVTERPTVEKLANEGQEKLYKVVSMGPVVEASGEGLNKVIAESEKSIAKVRTTRNKR